MRLNFNKNRMRNSTTWLALSACAVAFSFAPIAAGAQDQPPPPPPPPNQQMSGEANAGRAPQGAQQVGMVVPQTLTIAAGIVYMEGAGLPDMAINGAWNKRCGPGGGTRRLHQIFRRTCPGEGFGGEIGSTRVVKTHFLLGMIPPLSGHITSANDNHEALAIAA